MPGVLGMCLLYWQINEATKHARVGAEDLGSVVDSIIRRLHTSHTSSCFIALNMFSKGFHILSAVLFCQL